MTARSLDQSDLTADIDGAFLAAGGIERARRGVAEGTAARSGSDR
jgi:hypothetical protein